MKKKELESAIKNNDTNKISGFFSSLLDYFDAKKCEIYVYIVGGSGCDSPIINKQDGVYKFDTYGTCFKNWREWDSVFHYGTSGTTGSTNSLKCVFNSCISFNRENNRVALISEDVYNDLVGEGYKLVKLKTGFR